MLKGLTNNLFVWSKKKSVDLNLKAVYSMVLELYQISEVLVGVGDSGFIQLAEDLRAFEKEFVGKTQLVLKLIKKNPNFDYGTFLI